MPLDLRPGGAPAPTWSQYLDRLKQSRAARRRDEHTRRRVTKLRLAQAEDMLGRIIDGADFLAELEEKYYLDKGVCLFVTMTVYDFKRLCRYGAELEDDEDTDGGEADMDLEPDADDEPSLGATEMFNQARWAEGYHTDTANGPTHDLEADGSDLEPSLGRPEARIDQTDTDVGGRRDLERPDDDESDWGVA